ncbi:MAG: helix-turn-helix transcriptional regulator [Lentisphaeria bacterium]|nr:helix-turn-helix transcriptional regulator [Lentisphaeria bacterium]
MPGNVSGNSYFDDLSIRSVSDVEFTGSYLHRLSRNRAGLFSLEMIAEGEVLLELEKRTLHLKGPVLFWDGDFSSFFCFHHLPAKKHYRHLWVDFTGERGKRIIDALQSTFPGGCVPLVRQSGSALLAIFEELYRIFHQPDGYDSCGAVLLVEKLVYLALEAGNRLPRLQGDPFNLFRIYDSFRYEPFQEFDIGALASARGISVVYLRKLFKNKFSLAIGDYVFRMRMQSAAEILKTESFRITELADKCGFSTVSPFSNAFRRFFGVSPRAYRRSGGKRDASAEELLASPGGK